MTDPTPKKILRWKRDDKIDSKVGGSHPEENYDWEEEILDYFKLVPPTSTATTIFLRPEGFAAGKKSKRDKVERECEIERRCIFQKDFLFGRGGAEGRKKNQGDTKTRGRAKWKERGRRGEGRRWNIGRKRGSSIFLFSPLFHREPTSLFERGI